MFAFLRRWFREKPFGDRDIFEYWDGSERRYGDPLVLQRACDAAGGDNWTQLLPMLKLGQGLAADVGKVPPEHIKANAKKASEAAVDLVAIVRKAFHVEPFKDDGGRGSGLTDSECLGLLGQFFLYLQGLEEEATPLPSLPQSTASPTASSPIG